MNPACEVAPGCGKWEKPLIANPEYKGTWSAPMIENPDYKGEWHPRKIKVRAPKIKLLVYPPTCLPFFEPVSPRSFLPLEIQVSPFVPPSSDF